MGQTGISDYQMVLWFSGLSSLKSIAWKWTYNTSHSRNSWRDRDLYTSALVNSYIKIECIWDFVGPERKLLNCKDRIIGGKMMLAYTKHSGMYLYIYILLWFPYGGMLTHLSTHLSFCGRCIYICFSANTMVGESMAYWHRLLECQCTRLGGWLLHLQISV